MNTSAFDPQAFLDAQITEAFVKRPPIPAGEYVATIGEISVRTWSKNEKSGIAFDIPVALEIPSEVQQELGIDFKDGILTMKDSVFVNLNEAGMIDTGIGKNRGLRNYREATGTNTPGEPFSPRMFTGKVITVKIKHEIYEGEPVERIGGVAKS